MTTATTATMDFTIDEHITLALQAMALHNPNHPPPDAGTLAFGRKQLFIGMQALANDGIILRAKERAEISLATLSVTTPYIEMASDTNSVEQGGMLRATDGLQERPVNIQTIGQYQALSQKKQEGVPTLYFPEERSNGTWRVYFWPVGNSDFPTAIIPRTRRLRDTDTGTTTLDLDRKWHLAVQKFLGSILARSKGRRDLASEVWQEYLAEVGRAEDDETERGPTMVTRDEDPWDY